MKSAGRNWALNQRDVACYLGQSPFVFQEHLTVKDRNRNRKNWSLIWDFNQQIKPRATVLVINLKVVCRWKLWRGFYNKTQVSLWAQDMSVTLVTVSVQFQQASVLGKFQPHSRPPVWVCVRLRRVTVEPSLSWFQILLCHLTVFSSLWKLTCITSCL